MKAIRASEGDKLTDTSFEPVIPSSETITDHAPRESFPSADNNQRLVENDVEAPEESVDQNVTTTHESVAEQPTEIRRTRTRIVRRPERLI
jgi:hypothetical protein